MHITASTICLFPFFPLRISVRSMISSPVVVVVVLAALSERNTSICNIMPPNFCDSAHIDAPLGNPNVISRLSKNLLSLNAAPHNLQMLQRHLSGQTSLVYIPDLATAPTVAMYI